MNQIMTHLIFKEKNMTETFEEKAQQELEQANNTYEAYQGCFKSEVPDGGLVVRIGDQILRFPWLEFAKNWHSDEEYQELLSKYSGLNDNYEKEVIRSSKLETSNSKLIAEGTGLLSDNAMLTKKIADLKSQLKQQPLPEVPEFVAELVDYTVNVQHTIPSDIIDYFYSKGETCSIEGLNLPRELKWEKLSEYFKIGYRRYEFEKACIIGYTVQKPKRFYLKHIDASKRDPDYDYYLLKSNEELDHEWVGYEEMPEAECFKFTQEEIDNMQTGSYEKIEVEE